MTEKIIGPGIIKKPTLPPAIPGVSFSIDLGKELKGKEVNFDYKTFYNYAKKRGLSDENISDLDLMIWPKKLTAEQQSDSGLLSDWNGIFRATRYNKKLIGSYYDVNVDVKLRKESDTNKSIAHELSHYEHWLHEDESEEDEKAYKDNIRRLNASSKTAQATIIPATALVGFGVFNEMLRINGNNLIDSISPLVLGVGFMATAMTMNLVNEIAFSKYSKDLDEIKARTAAKALDEKFITIDESKY